jgi:succinyl-diaminopimelate desuccinylase
MSDVLELTCDLMQCASVTPDDAGCQALIAARLARAGFASNRCVRRGATTSGPRTATGAPVLALLGHTDVVPSGPREALGQ